MGLRIATNLGSIATQRALNANSQTQTKSFQRLASGQRIINASDDAAGLSISENLRAQIRSMTQAERNTNDGISFVQVAEGGLNEVGNILIRMRELAVQAASETIGDTERGFIDQEVQSLIGEIDRIANVTSFNGTPLLNGERGPITIQVGIRREENNSDQIILDPAEFNTKANVLGINSLDYKSAGSAREALDSVDQAISKVFESRARLGAAQNRLQTTVNTLGIAKENLSAARSRIADVDLAAETAEFVRSNILTSAGVSVLAQANASPQQALKLLA